MQRAASAAGPWTTLTTLDNTVAAGPQSYDISGSISATTTIRFYINSGFTNNDDESYVDNIDISYNAPVNAVGTLIRRTANLTGATYARLNFSYASANLVAGDTFVVEASNNAAGPFTTLATFTGGVPNVAPPYNLASFIPSANTTIRFRVTGGFNAVNKTFSIDNVDISYVLTPSTFASGNAPDFLSSSTGCVILPGGSLTLNFNVTVDDHFPTGQTSITNTASMTSAEMPIAITASATNTVLVSSALSASAGGRVWLDSDEDGVQDIGEPGIPNIEVTLRDRFGTPVATTLTDGNGHYLFNGVMSGTGYYVELTDGLSPGRSQTFPVPPGLNRTTSFSLADGQVYTSADLGYRAAAGTALTIAKSVAEPWFMAAGDILHYSYLVTNSGSAPLAGPVTVADDKSTGETCPAVSTVGDFDNYLDPGESITCTATYTVTAGDVIAGFVTNTASATVDGVTSNTDTITIVWDGIVVGDGTSPADKDVNRTVVDVAVSAFTLNMSDGISDTVTGLVITGTNTADVAANGVKIWIDNNGDSEWDSGDTQVGSGVSFSGNTATFTGLSLSVTTSPVKYIITYDISASATINDTLTGVVTGVTASTPVTNNDTTDATLTILGDAPTAVKLIFFEAVKYDDGVLIQWRTGHEVRNLGFNIYRDAGAQLERVNQQIVAGSALVAGPGVAVSAGRPYTWLDDSAGGTASYYLEDIDLSGKRTMYGPVTPVTAESQQSPLIGQSTTLSGLSGMHSSNKDSTLQLKTRLSTASAIGVASAQLINAAQTPEQAQWTLAGAPAVKIFVQKEGWHRITQPELRPYGLGNVDPRYLQLYVNGKQTPIVVSGEKDGHFDPQDYIEFYGKGLDTPSTDTQTYWLVAATTKGLRIQTVSGGTRVSEPSNFAFAVEARPRELYAPALPKNAEGDRFYGPIVFSEPAVVTLNVQHADVTAASSALLDVTLQGIIDGGHNVDVILNGTKIGQVVFSNMDKGHATLQFNQQGLLREGDNTLQLIGRGGDMDFSLVDVVRLTYRHTYTADNNALRFTANGGGKITVNGFSSSGIRVMDITDTNSVLEVSSTVAQKGTAYAAAFNVPSTGTRTLLAFNDNSILHPAAITSNNPSALHLTNNGADMVILTHSSMMSALTPLKRFRE